MVLSVESRGLLGVCTARLNSKRHDTTPACGQGPELTFFLSIWETHIRHGMQFLEKEKINCGGGGSSRCAVGRPVPSTSSP
jgi:hypothetical protein